MADVCTTAPVASVTRTSMGTPARTLSVTVQKS